MTKIKIATHRDVDIYVDKTGKFWATPKRARKEVYTDTFRKIREIIDKREVAAAAKRRKDANLSVRVFRNGKVHRDAKYVGVRGNSAGKADRGHVWELNDPAEKWRDPVTTDQQHLIVTTATDADVAILEAAAEALRKATERLREASKGLVVRVSLPYVGDNWSNDPLFLEKVQAQAVERIKDAIDPTTEEETND